MVSRELLLRVRVATVQSEPSPHTAAFPAIPDNGVIIKPSVVTCTIGTHLLGSVAPIGRRPIEKMWLTQFRPLLVSGLKNAVPLARNGVSALIDRRHMLRIARTLWAVFLRNMLR